MKILSISLLIVFTLILGGCSEEAKQGRGFRLPDGDIERGKQAFVSLKCNTCHTVSGVDLATPETADPHQVPLGGTVHQVKTYGQLVTAIIHPSHDISIDINGNNAPEVDTESPMHDFNSKMSVQEMIDLVTFLHSQYRLRTQIYYNHQYYPMFR